MPEIGPEAPLQEAFDTAIAFAGGIDADDHLYRSLTQVKNVDLSPLTQEKMQKIALVLYRINPLAHRIMKLSTAFVAAGNVNIDAPNPEVKNILKEHWEHPVNDWENKLYQRVFEIGMYGELCLPASVTPTGNVLLGYVSPLEIENVAPLKRDPSTPGLVILKKLPGETNPKTLKVINYINEKSNKNYGYRDGEAFFFPVNKVTDSMRGTSDLLPLADYLDALDQLLFNLLERVGHLNSYIWDVKLTGASTEKINAFLADVQSKPPKPGGVRAHNELVEWQAVNPTLQADDNSEHVRLYRNHILGGAGLAEWMYGDSGSAGRAVASEMAEPTYKSLITRQREIKGFISQILNFVIDKNIQNGNLSKDIDRTFTITLPKISLRDFQRTSGALYRSAQAIELMLKNNLIDEERGKKLANSLIDQLDLGDETGVTAEDLLKKIDNPQARAEMNKGSISAVPPKAPKPKTPAPKTPVNGLNKSK